MNMLQKFAMFAMLVFGLQAVTLQGAAMENDRREGVKQVLMIFKKTLDNPNHKPFNPDEFDYFNNYIQANNGLFAHVINHDMYAQDGTLVIKKGELLWNAIGKNNVQMVELLIAAGADVNIKNEAGWYPLNLAAKLNFDSGIAIVNLLIDAKADVNARDDGDGMTPLCWASMMANKEAVKLLLDARADVSIQNKDQQSPLHIAVNSERPFHNSSRIVVKLLLDAGASFDIKDKFGKTAEQRARTPEMKALFAQARIDREQKQKEADAQYEATFNAQGFNVQGFDRFGRNAAGLLEELD